MDSSWETRAKQSLGLKPRLKPSYSGSDPGAGASHEALGLLSLSFHVWQWLGARAGLVGWESLLVNRNRPPLLSAGCCEKPTAADHVVLACSIIHSPTHSFIQDMPPVLESCTHRGV